MSMKISQTGELSIPDTWQIDFEEMRPPVIAFCMEEKMNDHPELVADHLESVEMEFWADSFPETEPGSEAVSWSDKKKTLSIVYERTDDIIDFGDEIRFPDSINVLHQLKDMLKKIIDLIPE